MILKKDQYSPGFGLINAAPFDPFQKRSIMVHIDD